MTPDLPKPVAEAVARKTLDLAWANDRVVGACLRWDPSAFEVGRALLEWPATEGIEELSMDAGALFAGDPLLAARGGSLRSLRLASTYETIDVSWLSAIAPALTSLELIEVTAKGALQFPQLARLALHELADPLAAYASMRCPRVTDLSTALLPELGAPEAAAMICAFPSLHHLRTSLADHPHAEVVHPIISAANPPLHQWIIDYRMT